MKCPKCGRSNREEAIYCGGCGIKLRDISQDSSSLENTEVDIEAPKPPEERSKLVVISSGRSYELMNLTINLIGRRSPRDGIYPAIDLTEDDPERTVSRKHAQIDVQRGPRYFIKDLGSSNKTFVNGHPLEPNVPQMLNNGDEVRIGKVIARFIIPGR